MSVFLKNPYVASINQKGTRVNREANTFVTTQAYKVKYFDKENGSEG